MANFSVACAVTGIPFDYWHKAVAIPVERYKYWRPPFPRFLYVPRGFPVFGTYDNSGGLENTAGPMCRGPYALVHRDVWYNADSYFHYMNKFGFEMPIEAIMRRADMEKRAAPLPGYEPLTEVDCVYRGLGEQMTKNDSWLTLREMFEGRNVSKAGATGNQRFLRHNAFARDICRKLIAGWTAEDTDTVRRMIGLWQGQMSTGRYIMPDTPHVEQCPGYAQRIKILGAHLALAKRLAKRPK